MNRRSSRDEKFSIDQARAMSSDVLDVSSFAEGLLNEGSDDLNVRTSLDSDPAWEMVDKGTRGNYRPRLAMIVVPTMLFFFNIFMTLTLQVQIQISLVCAALQDGENCDSAAVSSKTGMIALTSKLAATIPSLLVSGFYASIANRYGRKIAMICPAIGHFCSASVLLLLAWADASDSISLSVGTIFWFSMLGAIFEGISGSFATYQMAVFSYASDITRDDKAKRGTLFSLLEAAVFFSKTVAPLAGGFWAQRFDFVVPIFSCVVACALTIIWCAFMMVEVREPDNNAKVQWNPFRSFRNVGLLLGLTAVQIESEGEIQGEKEKKGKMEITDQGERASDEGGTRECGRTKCVYPTNPMFYVSSAFFLYFSTFMSNTAIFFLFIERTHAWGPQLIGIYEALEGGFSFLGMVLVPFAVLRLFGGYIDIVMVLCGYLSRTALNLQLALASTDIGVMLAPSWLLFAAVVTPRSRAVISRCLSNEHQADALSGFAAVQGLSNFVTPLYMYVYTTTVYNTPSTIYFVYAGCTAVGALTLAFAICTPSVLRNIPGAEAILAVSAPEKTKLAVNGNPLLSLLHSDESEDDRTTPLLSED